MNESKPHLSLRNILEIIIVTIDSQNYSRKDNNQRIHIEITKDHISKILKDLRRRDSFLDNYKEIEDNIPVEYEKVTL